LPVVRLLRRRRSTGHQARLDAAGRTVTLKHAFAIRRPELVHGRRILILDDVFTTGATLSAAAALLMEGGAREISVITAARA
ncbi:MAG: ComF family protein, partial [Victivallales bacterium]|nr:ComF family protein [Victivallales bacterium]